MPEEDANLKQLREKADRADSLEVTNQAQAKELAFYKAGIPVPEDGPARLVFDTFKPEDGVYTPEAVLAYAGKYGVEPPKAEAPAGEPQQQQQEPPSNGAPPPKMSDAERAHFAQTSGAIGGDDGNTGGGNPYDTGFQRFNDAMKEGSKRENAAGAMMAEVFDAASKGNTQALYDQAAWREAHAG